MLEVRRLSKRFGAAPVLRAVDLAVRPGRVTALVGPNGAGKTTLIKLVLGLARPDAGTVLLDGAPAVGDAYRARVGYMPQIARFPENLTAAELVALVADLRGHPLPARGAAELQGAVAADPALDGELLDRFALAPHLGKPLRALSGGTRQKVNAVLAFLFRPELLILDEPTAGLDPVASAVLKDKVLAERGAGRTVVVTSHLMGELEELADDVAFLADGAVAFAGSVDALLRHTGQSRLERAVARLLLARAPQEQAA